VGLKMSPRFGPGGRPSGCRVCGAPLSFHQQVSEQLCGDPRCKAAALESAMVAHRAGAAAALGLSQPETYPVVVVPESPAAVVRLPEERKQAHAALLAELCTASAQAEISSSGCCEPPIPEAPVPLGVCVCRVCRGVCCHWGKDHAFLDGATIGRFVARSGASIPRAIVRAYAVFLPETSVEGGCIYQAADGCALPRWMRAPLCNDYRCQGLKQAEKLFVEQGTRQLYVVARRDNHIVRGAFVRLDHVLSAPA